MRRQERNGHDNLSKVRRSASGGPWPRLLERVGLTGIYSLTRLAGGANNRVYRVDAKADSEQLRSSHTFSIPAIGGINSARNGHS